MNYQGLTVVGWMMALPESLNRTELPAEITEISTKVAQLYFDTFNATYLKACISSSLAANPNVINSNDGDDSENVALMTQIAKECCFVLQNMVGLISVQANNVASRSALFAFQSANIYPESILKSLSTNLQHDLVEMSILDYLNQYFDASKQTPTSFSLSKQFKLPEKLDITVVHSTSFGNDKLVDLTLNDIARNLATKAYLSLKTANEKVAEENNMESSANEDQTKRKRINSTPGKRKRGSMYSAPTDNHPKGSVDAVNLELVAVPDSNLHIISGQRSEFLQFVLSPEFNIFSSEFDERSFSSSLSPFALLPPHGPKAAANIPLIASTLNSVSSKSAEELNENDKGDATPPPSTIHASTHIQSRYEIIQSSLSMHLRSKLDRYTLGCLEFEESLNTWRIFDQIEAEDFRKNVLGEKYFVRPNETTIDNEEIDLDSNDDRSQSREDDEVDMMNIDYAEKHTSPSLPSISQILPKQDPPSLATNSNKSSLSPTLHIEKTEHIILPPIPAVPSQTDMKEEVDESEIGVGWVEDIYEEDELPLSATSIPYTNYVAWQNEGYYRERYEAQMMMAENVALDSPNVPVPMTTMTGTTARMYGIEEARHQLDSPAIKFSAEVQEEKVPQM
ncbi:hypothetical protein HK098_006861 [Nowakowskiella sp. JEL0407]|nr:hypothetical protein HK098_006861 [Nowakowskiella sp. JEL0407]